jgi:hypothetical protein
MRKASEAPMNADPTPIAADEYCCRGLHPHQRKRGSSAFICDKVFICVHLRDPL